MFGKKSKKRLPEIGAGSMADIAFLLLIFFLVTTTVVIDKGIKVVLPPFCEDCPTPPVNDRNVFNIKVNGNDEVLIENEISQVGEIRKRMKTFILNPDNLSTLAVRSNSAVISLQNDRATSYDQYIQVYNEIKAAYNELWEEEAQKQFFRSYKDLKLSQKQQVRKKIPMAISEAEPFDLSMN